MAPHLRQAREDDLDRLVAIHASAFPDPRGHAARVRNFTHNPLGGIDHLWVLEDGGVLVAHAFLFELQAWFGGERVPVGGIATVGVAQEARRRRLGTALIGHLHDVARSRGDALTVLYPFRQAFYARMGYGAAAPFRRLRFDPAAIGWKPELPLRVALGGDRGAMQSCWEAAGVRRSGTLVRSARAWDAHLLDERRSWLVVDGGAGVEGYVAWTVSQSEPHTKTTLSVHEMAAHTDVATRSLWAAVGMQRGQIDEVNAEVADDDPVDRALLDADRGRFGRAQVEHAFGEVVGGPMVRMIGVARALAARGWTEAGTLVLAVGGDKLELSVVDGRARLVTTSAEPDIRLDEGALGAIAFGTLRVSHAARLGWVAGRDQRSIALADAVFALPPYFSSDRF